MPIFGTFLVIRPLVVEHGTARFSSGRLDGAGATLGERMVISRRLAPHRYRSRTATGPKRKADFEQINCCRNRAFEKLRFFLPLSATSVD